MKTLEERAEHEIYLIEQDESLSDDEKSVLIKEIYEQLREYERENYEHDE